MSGDTFHITPGNYSLRPQITPHSVLLNSFVYIPAWSRTSRSLLQVWWWDCFSVWLLSVQLSQLKNHSPLLFRAVYQGWHQSEMEKCLLGKLHPSYVRALGKNETFHPVCRTTVLKENPEENKSNGNLKWTLYSAPETSHVKYFSLTHETAHERGGKKITVWTSQCLKKAKIAPTAGFRIEYRDLVLHTGCCKPGSCKQIALLGLGWFSGNECRASKI